MDTTTEEKRIFCVSIAYSLALPEPIHNFRSSVSLVSKLWLRIGSCKGRGRFVFIQKSQIANSGCCILHSGDRKWTSEFIAEKLK